MRPTLLALLFLVPAAALARPGEADRRCQVDVVSDDGIVRTGDVEVGPGDSHREVVALDGRVRVKAGATVEDAVAVGGDVVVETGAVVRGDATAVGGDVEVKTGGRVEGDATSVGGEVRAAEGAEIRGDRSTVRARVNGRDLSAYVTAKVREKLDDADCRIEVR
jgi:UDP-3-O-[3-hydroxymyristoyl] glucosamine N-acyltransferase